MPARVNYVLENDSIGVKGAGNVLSGPDKVIENTIASGNQLESSRSPEPNGTVKTVSNETVNPSRQEVSTLQFQGNEHVSSKGTTRHIKSLGNENMVVKDGIGTNFKLSNLKCDDLGILAGKTFTVTSGILAKGILIN